MSESKYRRILLKIDGKAMAGINGFGIDPYQAEIIAGRISSIYHTGVEIAIVIGSGNLWKGQQGIEIGMNRATADYMGMLASTMNALALMDALERTGLPTRVQSALEMHELAEPFIQKRAISHLAKQRIVIFSAGTGNPFFSTDTAAVLRAVEINADVIIKGALTPAIVQTDSNKISQPKIFGRLSYIDALNQNLSIMDSTAISLCMDHKIPILFLSLWEPDVIEQALFGEEMGIFIGQLQETIRPYANLAGDSTTDAPLPDVKKKRRKRN